VTDLRIRHFLALAGAPGASDLASAELDRLWSALSERAARGAFSQAKLERARGGYELLRERSHRPDASHLQQDPLVRSRVRDDRTGRFVPVALLADLSVWSPAPGFETACDEVADTISAGAEWQGRGAAELAALVREIGRRITPNVGLVARDMGPWLDLYIAYETHSITLRAIREHFRRTAHPDLGLLYDTIGGCCGRRHLHREEVLQCTRFQWTEDSIAEGSLVGDEDHWRVPVCTRWRQRVHERGIAVIDDCFVAGVDEEGPLVIRPAGDGRFVVGR
jgi:hypothetical protein